MIRLYLNIPLKSETIVTPSHEQIHYLKRVMRLQRNDCISVFNGKNGEYIATISENFSLQIKKRIKPFIGSPPKALAVSLIKNHRMSWMFEKICELGVTDIYPLVFNHTQNKKFNKERYLKILVEASEQCGRLDIPSLYPVFSLEKFLLKLPSQFTWFFGDTSSKHPKKALASNKMSSGFVIGPEGGFSSSEKDLLQQHMHPISMGPLTLRTETAAIWSMCCKT